MPQLIAPHAKPLYYRGLRHRCVHTDMSVITIFPADGLAVRCFDNDKFILRTSTETACRQIDFPYRIYGTVHSHSVCRNPCAKLRAFATEHKRLIFADHGSFDAYRHEAGRGLHTVGRSIPEVDTARNRRGIHGHIIGTHLPGVENTYYSGCRERNKSMRFAPLFDN